jgi:hypothetical protein
MKQIDEKKSLIVIKLFYIVKKYIITRSIETILFMSNSCNIKINAAKGSFFLRQSVRK